MRVDANRTNHKFFTLSKFKGVDYSSSPMQVKNYRATDMENFLLKDGVLSKRNGFEQIKRFSNVHGYVSNIWKSPDGGYIYIVGTDESAFIYWCKKLPQGDESVDQEDVLLTSVFNITSRKASAFYSKDKMYILCGDYFVYGNFKSQDGTDNWQLKRVADDRENTYIPTTTINIVRENSKLGLAYPNQLNEKANLLINVRRNELVGEEKDEESGQEYEVYQLDGILDQSLEAKPPKVIVYYTNEDGITYKDRIEDFQVEDYGESWISPSTYVGIHSGSNGQGLFYIPHGAEETANFLFRKNARIIVEYSVAEDVNNVKLITTAKVGEIYGADGRADRLFVAGNDIAPNMVYYSENGADYTPNFTYFPIDHFVVCGQTQKEISALGRTSNGSLAVYKNVGSRQEPSVYFIHGSQYSIGADEAGVTFYEDRFNVSSGNIEVEGISPYSIVNFAGDSLFVGDGGVYAIELSANVASNDRYARERSRTINQKLNQNGGLKYAKAIVHDNKYYLAVGNEVYVADARYKYTLDADMDNTFNYEWFRLTGIDVDCWFVEDNDLYFIQRGGVDHWLCKFTGKYSDIYRSREVETLVYKAVNEELRISVDTDLIPIAEKTVKVETVPKGNKDSQTWSVDKAQYDDIKKCWYFSVPDNIELDEGGISLKMHLPINAYWQSAIMDLSDPIHRKNLYSISGVFLPKTNGRMEIGYKTRIQEAAVEAQGVNAFSFNNVDFCFFSFDCGGLANAFRRKCFERGFVCVQLLFKSNSIGDCAIDSITLEYNTTIKNIGVR